MDRYFRVWIRRNTAGVYELYINTLFIGSVSTYRAAMQWADTVQGNISR